MARPLSADVMILDGAGILEKGTGLVNAQGITAKAGGFVTWSDVLACRKVHREMGNASTGALTAGGVGLLFGPPVAGAAAAGGAALAYFGGARDLLVLRHASGADLLLSVAVWHSRSVQSRFFAKPGALQRMRGLLPGRTKGDA